MKIKKINREDLKRGMVIEIDGELCLIRRFDTSILHNHPYIRVCWAGYDGLRYRLIYLHELPKMVYVVA